jgi:hypothetical protein
LERKLKNELDAESLEAAIKEATKELNHRKTCDKCFTSSSILMSSLLVWVGVWLGVAQYTKASSEWESRRSYVLLAIVI